MYNDTAASDLIAVMALIAVFVTAAAIAGVALLSYPPGDAAPAMIARSVTENGTLYIYHDGGDPLEKEHFAILVDGGEWTENFSLVDASGIEYEPGTWTTWETGEVLVNKTPLGKGTPRIQIVGEGVGRTGSDWLLHEIGNGTPTTPTPTETTPTPTGTTPTPTETTPTPTETTPTPTETTPTPVSLVANFTANITAGLAPLSVQFTDTSTGEPTSWTWTFGDGNTSTVQHPIHTYAAPGIYTVSLTITTAGASATETKTGYIAVYNSSSPGLVGTYYPTREFTGTPVHRIDQRLRFADALAGEWYHCNSDEEDWPNSTLGKTEQFSVVYEGYLLVPADAVYTFYLTSDDGSRLWIDAVGEDAEPLIDNWDYHPPTEKNSTIHLSAGSHPIKVKMFENWNAAVLYLEWSSPDFERRPVESFCQGPPPVSADFTATPQNGTAPLEVQFTDTSTGGPTTWSWDFGDGGTSTERNPVHTYTAAGTYTVTLVAKNAGTSDTKTKTGYITAYGWPSPGLLGTYYPTMDWTGEGVTRIDRRIWFADNAANTAHYLNAGTDEYNWPIATLGKDDQFSVIYESYLVVPSDDTYTFYLTSDDGSWLWIDDMETALIDNGGYHSTQTMTAEIPLAAGSHKVMAKMFEGNGLAVFHLEWSSPAFARTPVDAFCRSPPPASADFTASPTSGSAPLSVQFTDTSAGEPTSWSWDFGGGGTSTEQNPVHTYIIPGTYTVTLTAENAHGSDTVTKVGYVTVTELQPPTVTAITPDSGESGTIVSITNLAGTDFQNGATVKLTKSGETDIHATGITFVSSTQITCSFNLAGAATGQWNIIVTNPDTQSGTLSNGFEITTGQIYKPEPDLNNELNHWTKSGSIDVVTVSGHGDVVKMTETSSIKRTLSTVGYENIQVSFSLAAVGFNNPNDAVVVEWFDGTSWHELLHIKGKNPLGDERFHDFSYSLPSSAKDNPSFEIRFGIEHQGKTESALVDLKKLEVTGDPI